jgi:hypothetical protein
VSRANSLSSGRGRAARRVGSSSPWRTARRCPGRPRHRRHGKDRRSSSRRSLCDPAEVNAEPMSASVVVDRAGSNVEEQVAMLTVDELVRADAGHSRRHDAGHYLGINAKLFGGLADLASAAVAQGDAEHAGKNDRLDPVRGRPLTGRVPFSDDSPRRGTCDRESDEEQGDPEPHRPISRKQRPARIPERIRKRPAPLEGFERGQPL